ncbi:MAG: UDP-N-acetylmuramate dehydrogenase [Atopobium sp.]|nr:UDP-N-acetylmuramate dehydrogenase [Atopobium sp.]
MSVFNAYMALSGKVDAEVIREERLSRHTTYRIGGPADLYVKPRSYPALVRTLSVLADEKVPWVVLGKGSNVLVSDAGYGGCVITLGEEFSKVSRADDGCITAGAGAQLNALVSMTLSAELSGMEFLVGIPGTVGGAVSMDAGTRHTWIGSLVRDVVTLVPGEGMRRRRGEQIEWGYRSCSLPTSEIILEVSFVLTHKEKSAIAAEMDAYLSKRRFRQPMGLPSCGSVFRNPPDASAAKLIEACGLKGVTVGGAQISEMHANFIVNRDNARASDVIELMRRMHDGVLAHSGIELRPEVKLLGFAA